VEIFSITPHAIKREYYLKQEDMEENRNPQGTGSEGDNNVETLSPTNKIEESQDKPQGGVSASLEEVVFGGQEQPKHQFASQEAAEKSYKESQRYADSLKKQLADKEQEVEVLRSGSVSPDTTKLEQEIAAIRTEQSINKAFNLFRDEHPDFTGSLQDKARDVIDTYIKAKKSIKMKDAYEIAKAMENRAPEPSIAQSVIQAASISGGNAGNIPKPSANGVSLQTQAMLDKYNDPRSFTPGIRKALNKK